MFTTNQLRRPAQQRAGRAATFMDGDASAWAISFSLHLAALVVLASLTLLLPTESRLRLSARPVEIEPEPLAEQFQFSQHLHDEVGALSEGGVAGARPVALVAAEESQIAYELEPPTPLADLQVLELDRTILAGPNTTENLLVKGAGSVGSLGAAGAIDRITHEILLSLDDRPTLVVWLFDQSGSLQAQREAIAARFDRVYDELGVIEAAGNPAFRRHRDKPLLTAVASFGATVELLTSQPTGELTQIQAAVRAVADDPSGQEYVFQAVQFLADRFRHYRLQSPRRNVMIVVFTDEAGDDLQQLDATIDVCRKFAMPVYVVGVPAPFGREFAYVTYIDPDPNFDQSPQRVPVHQGPESFLPEHIKLTFAGAGEDEQQIDSGFGPFGLCRLTAETGGLYFTVHPNRRVGQPVRSWEMAAHASHLSAFFDERVMRNYRPDYLTAGQYLRLLSSNRACGALVESARLSWTSPMENVRLRFPKIDDAQFARDLSVAQRSAARIEPKLDALTSILRQGEPDRSKVTRPRWQAGYDLAIGRALAVKVRTEGYNMVLAEAKQGLKFQNEQSDTWILRPAPEVTTNSALARDAADARKYLHRVVSDHPDTPWALLAERELSQPLGWVWRERFTDVAGRRERNQAGRNRPRPEPQMPQKPRRDPPAL